MDSNPSADIMLVKLCCTPILLQCPCGLREKALVLGTIDCRVESCQGYFRLPALDLLNQWSADLARRACCGSQLTVYGQQGFCADCASVLVSTGACSVAVSYKPPMLVTRVRLPACAYLNDISYITGEHSHHLSSGSLCASRSPLNQCSMGKPLQWDIETAAPNETFYR